MDKKKLIAEVKKILIGIDKEETESDNGYWETSRGAKFGEDKLKELVIAIEKA